MLVRMRTNFAGPQGTARAGKIIDLPKTQAEDLIKKGFAAAMQLREIPKGEQVQELTPQSEVATAAVAETQSASAPNRRRRGRPPKTEQPVEAAAEE